MHAKPDPDVRRKEALTRLNDGIFDVLVVGGGIVGAGVARDAAMRGLRVALLEQYDLASGTSSRSSRLLHGGLRYLEQGHVGLVHEASVEKKIIHRIAPHLAEPLGFIFPTYRPGGRPLWQLRVGVKIYDLLCSGRNFAPSRGFSPQQTREMVPGLRTDNLAGSVRYFDALTNDARLVIDTLRSAERYGATILNYASFLGAHRGEKSWVIDYMNCAARQRLEMRAHVIVNAGGPWANKLEFSTLRLRLSKGIHLVVRRDRLPVPSAVVVTEGKRLLFVIPWGERVIIGTTDTDYPDRPEDVAVAAEDVTYVLRIVNEFFPSANLREADLISGWAGIRPLIANPDGTPSDISRAHLIRKARTGWWDIGGGKLTTYRLMAEQAVDEIVEEKGFKAGPCRTATEPLLAPDQVTTFSGIHPPAITREAVEHYVRYEWARQLEDVMDRRSGWHYHDQLSYETVSNIARWMGDVLGWSLIQTQSEINAQVKRQVVKAQ
jgi:glycerol-3-phosphate dehydrogenase